MVKGVTQPKGLRIQCKYCPKDFASQTTRGEHHKNIHPDLHTMCRRTRLDGFFPCYVCGLKLGSAASLRKHRRRDHRVNGPARPEVNEMVQDSL
jgi:hypothetical protein